MQIVCDIGGSKMRFARILNSSKIDEPKIVKTPGSYIESMNLIKEIVDELSNGEEISSLIGGIAGVLNKEQNSLVIAPNLKDWIGKPIISDMVRMTGAQVKLKNDTDMTGLGEAAFGSGKGFNIVAYLTFSTGIGGSLIVDNKIGPYSFGYEPGFQIINSEKRRPLHDVAGTALKERYQSLMKDIKDENILKDIMTSVIAGIHNSIVFWSPDCVVLGGGMTENFVIREIEDELKKMPLRFPELPIIKISEMGDLNGLYGSLEFTKQNFGIHEG